MNEIKDFSELRPEDEQLDDATSSRVWEAVISHGPTTESSSPAAPRGVSAADAQRTAQVSSLTEGAEPQRRRRFAILGAAAAIVAGVAGVAGVAVIRDSQTTPSTPAAQPTELPASPLVEPSTAPAIIANPPLLDVNDPAWELVDFTDVIDPAPGGNRAATVIVPEAGIDAGWISIVQSPVAQTAGGALPNPTTIAADLASSGVSLDDPFTSRAGAQYAVDSARLDQAVVRRTVEAIINGGAVPDGFSVLAGRDVNQFSRQLTYEFAHPDGRRLFVNVLPRGETLASEIVSNAGSFTVLDATRTLVESDDESTLLDRRGFWTLQISASPTFDATNALDAIAPLIEIDAATRNQQLPEAAEPALTPVEDLTTETATTDPATLQVDFSRTDIAFDSGDWEQTYFAPGVGSVNGPEARFVDDAGHEVQVNLYPGGTDGFVARTVNEFPSGNVRALGDFEQVATYPSDDRFRYNALLDNDTVIEIDGTGFANVESFLEVVPFVTITTSG